MQYWLDLFTGATWKEFQAAGATVSGYSNRMRGTVAKMRPGDLLLCYLTGVMRWVGALQVVGPSKDNRAIWSDGEYSARVEVKALIMLAPENGVPLSDLEGKVSFYQGPDDRPCYRNFLRRTPGLFKCRSDGDLILDLIRKAEANPIPRPVDPARLARRPLLEAETKKGRKIVQALVSVPGANEEEGKAPTRNAADAAATTHTQIQSRLLRVGAEMGFAVWVARNDRGKAFNGVVLGNMPGIVEELPTQFNEATNRTVELIDVLWLKGNSIVAAFEVECTTAIYSGLLRMSDLLALQPNLNIKLYIVAPNERRQKVEQEILRPTFMLREKPLIEDCGFLAIEELTEKIDAATKHGLISVLRPEFLERTAVYFSAAE